MNQQKQKENNQVQESNNLNQLPSEYFPADLQKILRNFLSLKDFFQFLMCIQSNPNSLIGLYFCLDQIKKEMITFNISRSQTIDVKQKQFPIRQSYLQARLVGVSKQVSFINQIVKSFFQMRFGFLEPGNSKIYFLKGLNFLPSKNTNIRVQDFKDLAINERNSSYPFNVAIINNQILSPNGLSMKELCNRQGYENSLRERYGIDIFLCPSFKEGYTKILCETTRDCYIVAQHFIRKRERLGL